jgi:hypothetical protein
MLGHGAGMRLLLVAPAVLLLWVAVGWALGWGG